MSDVSTQSDAVKTMAPDWDLARALLGGTRAMRAAGKTHMPQWTNETNEAYDTRLKQAVLFPAYKRTVETLTGKPFSKPITIGEDVPEQIVEWLADVDMQGRNLDAFAADMMELALGYGLGGILVDYPDASTVERNANGVVTKAAEKAAGLRPYLVQIFPWQLLGWRARRESGAWKLTQLRFMECVEEEDGEFGMKEVQQVRVLELAHWSTYRQNEKKEWILHEGGRNTLGKVPFVPVYGQRTGFMTAKPPMIEMAHMNVQHWQDSSDQAKSVKFARVRMAAITGAENLDDKQITIGSDYFMKLPKDCDIKVVQGSAESVKIGREELAALEEQMRQAGAELLVIKPGQITATQVATENAVGMCALQRITQGLEDAVDQALQIMGEWVGLPEGGNVTIYNDFGAATLAEASAELLLKSAQAGKLSDETYLSELKRRGILAPEVDAADERERIDAQGPAPGEMTGGSADVPSAVDQLNAAIALHEKHMNGTAPTTGAAGDASQQKMMDQMMAALTALKGSSMESMKGM